MESQIQVKAINKADIILVVSGFHGELDWIRVLHTQTSAIHKVLLYEKLGHLIENTSVADEIVRVQNFGINMYDICHFIVNNYENLEGRILFLKSNSFSRSPAHSDFDEVVRLCNADCNFKSLEIWHPTYLPVSTHDSCGDFLELNNNWLSRTKLVRKFFNEYDDYLNFYFTNYTHQQYLRFPPGGNFLVASSLILKHPKYLYEGLLESVSYDAYPLEMMYLERAFYSIFSGNLIARPESQLSPMPSIRNSAPYLRKLQWRLYTRLLVIAEGMRPK
jgi:hypothetical protein